MLANAWRREQLSTGQTLRHAWFRPILMGWDTFGPIGVAMDVMLGRVAGTALAEVTRVCGVR